MFTFKITLKSQYSMLLVINSSLYIKEILNISYKFYFTHNVLCINTKLNIVTSFLTICFPAANFKVINNTSLSCNFLITPSSRLNF